MRNKVNVFSSPAFGDIRTSGTADNPLFCLTDVCRALGLGNPSQVKTTLNQRWVITNEVSTPIVSQGVNTGKTKVMKLNFISEPNLYKCIFQSRKKEAEQFQDWVTSEVLPSIRKQGGYMVARENETDEDLLARALVVANASIKRRDEMIKSLREQTNEQKKELVEVKTQVESLKLRQSYLDVVLSCKSTIKTKVIAQDYGYTAIAFNKILHDMGIQYKNGDTWFLYSKYVNNGYVNSIPFTFKDSNGNDVVKFHPQWTQKGRMFLYNTLKANGIMPLIEKTSTSNN